MPRNHYIKRLLARAADLLLTILISVALNRLFGLPAFGYFLTYLLYNFTVILVDGTTFGKAIFSLKLETYSTRGAKKITLTIRELLVYPLLPLLCLNALMLSPRPLHDAIMKTRVIQGVNA